MIRMELRQLQSLVKLIDCQFRVSKTAEEMFLVQSAVSQHLKKLEDELGVELFIRKGKRLIGLTDVGQEVAENARQALAATNNIRTVGLDHNNQDSGILRIGTTHTQARYVLPPVLKAFNAAYPGVELQIHQGTPRQLVQWAINDDIDFSICTEELAQSSHLTNIPCYRWNRCLITLEDHPLSEVDKLSLEALCDYPLITYVSGFTGRETFNETFAKAGLKPQVVLSAADTDIVKTYVLEGMGAGVIVSMAIDEDSAQRFCYRDLSALFPWEVTRVAYLNDKYLRRYEQTFIDLFLQHVAQSEGRKIRSVA